MPCLFGLFRYTLRPDTTLSLFPYTTLFRSGGNDAGVVADAQRVEGFGRVTQGRPVRLAPHDDRHRLCRHPRLPGRRFRSEEHTSELQSRGQLVCRLLLEKKNTALLANNNTT